MKARQALDAQSNQGILQRIFVPRAVPEPAVVYDDERRLINRVEWFIDRRKRKEENGRQLTRERRDVHGVLLVEDFLTERMASVKIPFAMVI